jgi:hypothetical protein
MLHFLNVMFVFHFIHLPIYLYYLFPSTSFGVKFAFFVL